MKHSKRIYKNKPKNKAKSKNRGGSNNNKRVKALHELEQLNNKNSRRAHINKYTINERERYFSQNNLNNYKSALAKTVLGFPPLLSSISEKDPRTAGRLTSVVRGSHDREELINKALDINLPHILDMFHNSGQVNLRLYNGERIELYVQRLLTSHNTNTKLIIRLDRDHTIGRKIRNFKSPLIARNRKSYISNQYPNIENGHNIIGSIIHGNPDLELINFLKQLLRNGDRVEFEDGVGGFIEVSLADHL